MRKIFNKKELLILAPIFLAAVVLYILISFSPKASAAIIEIDGKTYKEISLNTITGPETLVAPGDMEVTILIDRDFVQITDSPCPDKLCVRPGKITKAGQSAVCLPAKVSVRLKGSGGADGVTY